MQKQAIKTNKKKKQQKTTKTALKLLPKHIELKGFLSFFILHELDKRATAGDELAITIGGRKGSTLTPGTIYPALKRLRKQKLIKYTKNGRKKVYYLTSDGKSELKSLYFVLGDLFSGIKGRLKR